jgi:5-methylcytosine-specific restriction protein A
MATYLLTWNPNSWNWGDLPDVLLAVRQGRAADRRWSCGNTKSVPLGARVFLLRQGVEPKGIIASGWVIEATFEGPHWNADRAASGDVANFVRFVFEILLDPSPGADPPLDSRGFHASPLADVNWSTPASGIRLVEPAALELENAWAHHLPAQRAELGVADELPTSAVEGVMTVRFIKHRSRERALRATKLADFAARSKDGKVKCEVPSCGFDFEKQYGEIGRGFAHVHHLRPLAEVAGPIETRLEDLAVVCPNCHAMIHAGGESRPLESLIRHG